MADTALHTHQCPSCQTPFEVYLAHSQYFGCPHCRAWIQLNSDNLPFVAHPKTGYTDSLSFVKIALGMTATFDQQKYRVIARTRWGANYIEYYETQTDSGTKTGYQNNSSKYDVWRLQNLNTDQGFWLIQTERGFYFSQIFQSPNPGLPYNQGQELFANFVNSYSLRVTEYGKAYLYFFEGEANELPLINLQNQLKYYRCNYGSSTYTLEIEYDNASGYNLEPYRYTQETAVDNNRLILEAFADNASIQKTRQNAKSLIFARNLSIFVFIGLFILFMLSFGEKKVVFRHHQDFGQLGDTLPKFTPEFELKNQAYLIELEVSLPTYNNQEVYITTELYDEEEEVMVNELAGDFWYYSGYDDGERWTDSQTYTSQYMQVRYAGAYSAEFFVEPKEVSGHLIFRVREAGMIWYYYLTPLLIVLLVFVIVQLMIYWRKLE
ncbi:MAG: hypothetical protein MUE85_22465 [Microscillaceae bacterium]|jgi:hypothetical protein|nr:hypothetical protein [Microscillaceae bacterium]